jgi:hypothetical protein
MQQTASRLTPPSLWDIPTPSLPKAKVAESEGRSQPLEIKMGKMIFYVTIALGLWFFYWFNGIQCPC